MDISYLEKYKWASLISTLIFLGYYAIMVFQLSGDMQGYAGKVIQIYLTAIVMFTLVQIVLSVLILRYTRSREIKKDERDILIESKAYRNSYFFIFAVVNLLLFWSLLSSYMSNSEVDKVFIMKPFMIFHILFAVIFIAHITQLLTQLYYYRKGV